MKAENKYNTTGNYMFTCPKCGKVSKLGEVTVGLAEIATVDGICRPEGTWAVPTGTSDAGIFDQECDTYLDGYWCLACGEKVADYLDELIEEGSLVLLDETKTESNEND